MSSFLRILVPEGSPSRIGRVTRSDFSDEIFIHFIWGCAYDNIASYKTLINAGFIPGYEILDYKIK